MQVMDRCTGEGPRPERGEVLWLIHRQGKPKAAIAARAFE